MYVVTFYSFKGGVGRTQALVNVAAEFAQRGKRVLVVDFDLEAPGISTYSLPAGPTACGGLVEYVTHYLHSLEAPDVTSYVSPFSSIGRNGGGMWVMPSGKHDASYAHRLAALDWERLYEQSDGFYLFEDLKLQWANAFRPDYVLIDSRTGHTDVGGICTRQLPDTVAVFFLPNEQNLNGLAKIVHDVRDESRAPRRKRINLEFVLSNVPDIDDEEGILQKWLARFQATLGYDALSGRVHRYADLALLNQQIFTVERARTRLAKEYRALTNAIAINNIEDREGAVDFVASYVRKMGTISGERRLAADERLSAIAQRYAQDGEVLERVAAARMREGRFAEALTLWDQVVASGRIVPDILLQRAEARYVLGDAEAAVQDMLSMLDLPDVPPISVSRAVGWLRDVVPGALETLGARRAIQNLDADGKIMVSKQLHVSREGQHAAVEILQSTLAGELDYQQSVDATNELAMCLIGLSRYRTAMDHIERLPKWESSMRSLFNYAMAAWGDTGTPNAALFATVCENDSLETDIGGANYAQCLAIAYAVSGWTAEAQIRLDESRTRLKQNLHQVFSCWRYLYVSRLEFEQDLDAIASFMLGQSAVPLFMQTQRSLELVVN